MPPLWPSDMSHSVIPRITVTSNRRVFVLLKTLQRNIAFVIGEQFMILRMIVDQCLDGKVKATEFPKSGVAFGNCVRVQ